MPQDLERELYRSIIENPDDPGLRQVYADLLAERGDERAAFITLQCELAGLPAGPRRDELEAAEREILSRRWAEWVGEARLAPGQLKFVRGFPEAWTCTPADFIANARLVVGATPLRRLALFPIRWRSRLKEALACPEVRLVSELELHNLDEWPLEALARAELPRLRRLELANGPDLPPEHEPLAARLPALETLELRLKLPFDHVLGFTRELTALKRVVIGAGHGFEARALERLRAHFGDRLTLENY